MARRRDDSQSTRSGEVTPKYVVFDPDRHGNPRYYFRRSGRKVRLRSEPGTPAFDLEYAAALAGNHLAARTNPHPKKQAASEAPKPDTLRWLFDEYMKRSREWKSLGDTTRQRRETVFREICNEPLSDENPTLFGTQPFKQMRPRTMRVIRDRCKTPATQNARVKAFRAAYAWAVKDEQIDDNPAKAVEYWTQESDGFHTWTVEEIHQYRERHPIGTTPRLAIDLLILTGQRRSDIVALGRQHVRSGSLTFTQFKGRTKRRMNLTLPILPELQASIDAKPSKGMTFLETVFDKPFTAKGFGNRFRGWCDQAGLPHCCGAHGLRKAGAVTAAERGATINQLMAIFGWVTAKQAILYTKKAEQKKLAAGAMALLG